MEAERFISDYAGCGPFQVWLTLATYLVKVPAYFGFLMMSFGGYNPGWACVESNTTAGDRSIQNGYENLTFGHRGPLHLLTNKRTHNISFSMMVVNASIVDLQSGAESDLEPDVCESYTMQTCTDIRFPSDVQTIVTEWSLICDKAWIPPLIISIELLGFAVSSNLAGHLADRYGRKTSMYTWVALSIVTNLIAAFAPSWEVLAVIMFFVGLSAGGNLTQSHIYPVEFVNTKWRSTVTGFPSTQLCGLLLGLCMMWLRHWRYVCIANAVVSFVALLTAFWVPESLRWLMIHRKHEEANKVAVKICRYNRRDNRGLDSKSIVALPIDDDTQKKKYSIVDLFTPQLRKITLLISLYSAFLSSSLFALNFGIGSLFGNFFINFIFYSVLPLPVSFTGPLFANKIGRKNTMICLSSIVLLSCVSIVVINLTLEEGQVGLPTTCLALFISVWLQVIFGVYNIFAAELFPTVVRSNGFGFAQLIGRGASMSAPYILPQGANASLTAPFTILAALMLGCVAVLLGLPETSKRALQDFVTKETDGDIHGEKDGEGGVYVNA